VTSDPATEPAEQPMIRAFPEGGALIRLAYRELDIAANGTKEQVKSIGNPHLPPRPWPPAERPNNARGSGPGSRTSSAASTTNTSGDIRAVIPCCWPQHPHLVHEISVLADQRRRAGNALTSDALVEWHRARWFRGW
jgi:hypothetical protein